MPYSLDTASGSIMLAPASRTVLQFVVAVHHEEGTEQQANHQRRRQYQNHHSRPQAVFGHNCGGDSAFYPCAKPRTAAHLMKTENSQYYGAILLRKTARDDEATSQRHH